MKRSLVLLALCAAPVASAVPYEIVHQGRLFDADGAALDEALQVKFSIYDQASSGAVIWTETQTVTFDNGYFSVRLGALADLSGSTFETDELYLAIAVGGGAELPLRVKLGSVPFAIRADSATNVSGGVVDATEIRVNGQVVIGADGTPAISFDDLADLPSDLADGDDDTLGGLDCAGDGLAWWDGSGWTCSSELDASVITTGTVGVARLPVGTSSGTVAAGDHGHAFSQISGVATVSQLPVGTGADQVAAGDHTHAFSAITGTVAYSQLPVGTTANTVKAGNAPDNDTLGGLDCETDEIPSFDGSAWICKKPAAGGGALVVSVDFDETSGSRFADKAGGGNDLVAVAGGLTGGSTGHVGRSVSFSGGVLRAASGNTIPDSPYVTFEAWVRPSTDLTGDQVVAHKRGAWKLTQKAGKMEFSVTGAGGTCSVTHVTSTVIGRWHHVGAFYNGRDIGVLVDGASVTGTCARGPLAATLGQELFVGAEDASAAKPFSGFVDELRVWSTAPLTGYGAQATATPTNLSCKTLLAANSSLGNGTQTIDPDGDGPGAPFQVWCDMGNGGWTYAAQNVKFRREYTGYPQAIVTPLVETEYDFVAFGASSGMRGAGNETPGTMDQVAPGGRAAGRKVMPAGAVFYVHVGGQGSGGNGADDGSCQGNWGGWNGGGRGSRGGSGGGGATDVRLVDGDLNSRILVAGGAGGCGSSTCDYLGGQGGGLTGQDGVNSGGRGGTQTAGGVSGLGNASVLLGGGRFGYGGEATQCNDEGGGGGGWYGGGAGGVNNRSAGGGSSYVGGVLSGTTSQGGAPQGHGSLEFIFK